MKELMHYPFQDTHHTGFVFKKMKSSAPVEAPGTSTEDGLLPVDKLNTDVFRIEELQRINKITKGELKEFREGIGNSILQIAKGKQELSINKETVAIHDLPSSIAMLQIEKKNIMNNPQEYNRVLNLIGKEHPSLLNRTSSTPDLQTTEDGLMLTYLDAPEVGYLITTSNEIKIVPTKPVPKQEIRNLKGFDIAQQRQMDRIFLGVNFREPELKNFIKDLVGFPSTVEGLSQTGSLIVRNEEQADTKIRLENGATIKILGLASFSRKVEGVSIPYVKVEFVNQKDGALTEGTIAATYIGKLQELAVKRTPILEDDEMKS